MKSINMTEQELWDKAHRTANEAQSLCILGWIKPEQGRPHLARLRKIVNELSGTVQALENLVAGVEPPKVG